LDKNQSLPREEEGSTFALVGEPRPFVLEKRIPKEYTQEGGKGFEGGSPKSRKGTGKKNFLFLEKKREKGFLWSEEGKIRYRKKDMSVRVKRGGGQKKRGEVIVVMTQGERRKKKYVSAVEKNQNRTMFKKR